MTHKHEKIVPLTRKGKQTETFRVRVECHAGYRADETPRRFTLGGRGVEVDEIMDRWQGPDHRYFKLLGDDGAMYILRHDLEADRWDVTLFEAGPATPVLPVKARRQ